MTMQAGFEALTSEAAEWDTTSEALATAAGTVATLLLSSAQFSALASTTGVASSYAAARQHVEAILDAGERETAKLADALRQVRADFQSTDQATVDAVSGLWAPE